MQVLILRTRFAFEHKAMYIMTRELQVDITCRLTSIYIIEVGCVMEWGIIFL